MNLFSSHRAPLSVHIGLANRYNSRCRYCRFDRLASPDYWTRVEEMGVLENGFTDVLCKCVNT